jgi:bifunctional UDP-N-acetylglucosamine pyrophosphorylase/glucosamine-1-phosphate N-acetyltransferase
MKSDLPKVVHRLAGKPMLQHVIDTASQLEAEKIHIVVGHGAEVVKQTIHNEDVNWCLQAEQLGTGHAVAQATDAIPAGAKVLILYGDVPLTSATTLIDLISSVEAKQLSLLTVELENPTGYGRIIRNSEGEISAIVEEKDASEAQRYVTEVNTGILAMSADSLHRYIPLLKNSNAQGEYYLTDIIEIAVNNGDRVESHQPKFEQEVQGVNNRLQLCELECWHQSRISEQLMLAGVTLYDPNRIDVRGHLEFGRDVVIDLNCIFEGDVTLGDGVEIGPNCIIKNATIGSGTTIHANSIIEDSIIGEQANVGPYARLRPGTQLANNTKIGNFVETKKTNVGEGSKINHLSYIGDTVLGSNVNVGAGTITCNYDGVNKFKTEIEDGVFVGSNTSLVAPIKVGKNATIGAGSTVTRNIDAEQLAVARGKQRNIDNWKRPEKK